MKLPMDFFGKARALSGTQTPWDIESGSNKAVCCVPIEFNGPGTGFSPEDLFLQSIISCFTGTMKVFAENSKVKYAGFDVEGVLTVDKNTDNQIVMKHVLLKIYPKGLESLEKFKVLAEKAIKSGFILNSVKTQLEYEIHENTDDRSNGVVG